MANKRQFLSERAVGALLATAIIILQTAWIVLIGYGAWRLLASVD